MATDYFCNIDPIKGESHDDRHQDWIDVISFSHCLSRGSTGMDFTHFNITKYADKASPDLNLYCAQGTIIDKLVFEACRVYGEIFWFSRYELENVIVQSVSMTNKFENVEGVVETVTFSYDTISWAYTPALSNGSAGERVGPKKWNLEMNKAE